MLELEPATATSSETDRDRDEITFSETFADRLLLQGVKNFDGFMVYETGDTKSVVVKNGCDYFGQINSVLTTGHLC